MINTDTQIWDLYNPNFPRLCDQAFPNAFQFEETKVMANYNISHVQYK
jgi:hypothetical protein